MENSDWSISGNSYSRLTMLLNEEQEDERSVATMLNSNIKAGHMTKIILQKPDFVNINEV
jgi:hypothetical protein